MPDLAAAKDHAIPVWDISLTFSLPQRNTSEKGDPAQPSPQIAMTRRGCVEVCLMLQDLRFAVRLLLKERWFSAVAIVALALGIGLNATVFTLLA